MHGEGANMGRLHLRLRESESAAGCVLSGFISRVSNDSFLNIQRLMSMFRMWLFVLLLVFSIVAAQERDKFCAIQKQPLPLPPCTVSSLLNPTIILVDSITDLDTRGNVSSGRIRSSMAIALMISKAFVVLGTLFTYISICMVRVFSTHVQV